MAEGYYCGMSKNKGRPGKDARLVIGAVIIKHKLCLSDEETMAQIQEWGVLSTTDSHASSGLC